MIRDVYRSFADFKHDVQETFAVDDHVIVRMIDRATHTATFEGVPAPCRRTRPEPYRLLLHANSSSLLLRQCNERADTRRAAGRSEAGDERDECEDGHDGQHDHRVERTDAV